MVISGIVVHGMSLGRTLGFPTANIALGGDIQGIERGVYLCRVLLPDSVQFWGVVSIGAKPTVDVSGSVGAECYILDYSGDLYGEFLELHLLDYIRGIECFSGVEELKVRIGMDVAVARLLISSFNV